ncbi:hypothetical protein RFI_25471 [Reticulomyxa filosa]|uniref:Nudix hydrolase domain-containing protein n=1 Tax=Reticulomyxa filosa TaxID=46433 RepID=X6ME47_RETFI|nr:hypothetical protein RFI_25471 [Reticulomyxa filosa]|eukprot:ETO11906.1 hypothetical protein RFI_25471 [Reticulomyxa filosa]
MDSCGWVRFRSQQIIKNISNDVIKQLNTFLNISIEIHEKKQHFISVQSSFFGNECYKVFQNEVLKLLNRCCFMCRSKKKFIHHITLSYLLKKNIDLEFWLIPPLVFQQFNFEKMATDNSISSLSGLCQIGIIHPYESDDRFPLHSLVPKETSLALAAKITLIPYSNKLESSEWKIYDIVVFYELLLQDQMKALLPAVIRYNIEKKNTIFTVVYHKNAFESPLFRQECTDLGANMITSDSHAFVTTCESIAEIKKQITQSNVLNCFFFGLTQHSLWTHCPLYHIGAPNSLNVKCPICIKSKDSQSRDRRPFQVHLHNVHGPPDHVPEYDFGTNSYVFALVVVRRATDNKYLMVQEYGECGFWLPAGRVDPGEDVCSAALRETMEEAGIDIRLKGILSVEFCAINAQQMEKRYNRVRVIFYAEPFQNSKQNTNEAESKIDNDIVRAPKSIPNYESIGACWISIEELNSGKVQLRGKEPLKWFNYVNEGKHIFDLDVLESWQS